MLVVKGGFAAHRELMAYIYELEVRFYRDLALDHVAFERLLADGC